MRSETTVRLSGAGGFCEFETVVIVNRQIHKWTYRISVALVFVAGWVLT